MPPKIIDHFEGFTVIGVSARTNNAKEQTPEGQIGKTWQRLLQEKFLTKIPNKADPNIISVYTNYAIDKEVPTGMVAVKIPAGRYARFTSEKGPAYKVVPETWKRIWTNSGGDRTYKADFEIYDQRATDPENSQVDIYVGIARADLP